MTRTIKSTTTTTTSSKGHSVVPIDPVVIPNNMPSSIYPEKSSLVNKTETVTRLPDGSDEKTTSSNNMNSSSLTNSINAVNSVNVQISETELRMLQEKQKRENGMI